MRNILQYPITKAEIVECLTRMADELVNVPDPPIGNMEPLLLRTAAAFIEQNMPEGAVPHG